MTGCKGYGLRGSDARTEIEHTKEADTPGEIPGRSGLQADRRTPRRRQLDTMLDTMSETDLKIMSATAKGIEEANNDRTGE